MNPQNYNILDLLPHKQPFIMVDRLTYYDPVVARTELTVREDNPFCHDGYMDEAGLIENIAQTCAARTGYKQISQNQDDNNSIKIGFIGMIKKMQIKSKPRIGDILLTESRIEEEVFNSTLVHSTVAINGIIIVECEMRIYLTDKTPE